MLIVASTTGRKVYCVRLEPDKDERYGVKRKRIDEAEWAYDTKNGDIWSSPVINNGVVYIGADDKFLHAIHLKNGTKYFSYETGGRVQSTAAIDSERGGIYFGSEDQHVYAIGSTGALLWKKKVGGPIYSSPIIGSGSMLYVGSDDAYLYALHMENGSTAWACQVGGQIRSPLSLIKNEICFGSEDSRVYCVTSEGNIKWSYSTNGEVQTARKLIVAPWLCCNFTATTAR